MPDVIIRGMQDGDCEDVSSLQCASFEFGTRHAGFSAGQTADYSRERGSVEAVRAQLHKHPCLVACEGSRIVGVIGVRGNEIAKLYVDPSRLRRGIGTALFEAAARVVAQDGRRELRLGTIFQWTFPFYAALGMAESGRRTVDVGFMKGAETILLTKALNPGERTGNDGSAAARTS